MDDEARQQLIAQAIMQAAREDAKRARANMPLGIVLCALGVAIATACTVGFELPGLMMLVGVGIGFVMIPGGLAVVIKSMATIARSNKILRDNAPAQARLVD